MTGFRGVRSTSLDAPSRDFMSILGARWWRIGLGG